MAGLRPASTAVFWTILALALGLIHSARAEPRMLETLQSVGNYLSRCMEEHGLDHGSAGRDVTLRMSLRRDGYLVGPPKITYLRTIPSEEERNHFVQSLLLALKACLPVPITPSLGGAIAGNPLAIRFLFEPKERTNI